MIRLHIQSDAGENAIDLIRAAIAAEVSRLELGLRTTERHIREFEERYQVSSDTFMSELAAEDLTEGDREYIAWAGEVKIRERIATQLETLKDIRYAA